MDPIVSQVRSREQVSRYRPPLRLAGQVLWAALAPRPRSFAHDAVRAMSGIRPRPEVMGAHQIPLSGPCLVTCNHYSRPGFSAWWLTLAISAAIAACRAPGADREIHWVMTAGWTFPGSRWRRRLLGPGSRWLFARVARVYGFVTMPPMPPDPAEVEARAAAVRQTLQLACTLAPTGGMIGLAPEGRDVPGGLGPPPPSAGRFLALLVAAGLPILPVGVTERAGRLVLSFGSPFVPQIPPGREARDSAVALQVMDAIARQLAG